MITPNSGASQATQFRARTSRLAASGAWLGRWLRRHWKLPVLSTAGGTFAAWFNLADGWTVAGIVLAGFLPGLIGAVWVVLSPGSFEVMVAGPWRRHRWRRSITSRWEWVCRDARLAERQMITRRNLAGDQTTVESWRCPRLQKVRTSGYAVELIIRARSGQTVAELEAGAERVASIMDAAAFRTWPVSGSTVAVELIMTDLLTEPAVASMPQAVVTDAVRLGRSQSGRDWWLPIIGRHTLCVGCSGSGKGSVLWGVCAGLAPAVSRDLVRLWGVDLKAGVELAMGRNLFSTFAKTPDEALRILTVLAGILETRGQVMAGAVRQHQPRPGDPLHVLVIDELAALTAYAPPDVRRDAERLLSLILTQGRALGVVVVAFVQDPRKEIVGMRGLFTQTLALRLRSGEETSMVLGEGMARRAPAHRISPAGPGTGWLVEDTGQVDRVRADYWPDPLIRQVAHRYPTQAVVEVGQPTDQDTENETNLIDGTAGVAGRRPRRSRQPRQPRQPRQRGVA